jgi:hypothetical protein
MKRILVLAVLAFAPVAHATTSNLDNHGIGDSAATAGAFVFRDPNALFALPIISTTAAALLVAPTGTFYWAQESVGGVLVTNAYNLAMSTANNVASCVYVAVSTSVPAKAGAACAN